MKLLGLILLASSVSAAFYHPYLTKPSEEVDSSEHGVLPGRKSTACKCGWANRVTSRIVGGRESSVNQFPWVAGITFKGGKFPFCGGTIISEYHVLTAAHCTEDSTASEIAIVAGEHNIASRDETDATQHINVRKIIDHEKYNDSAGLIHDLSLLVLEKPIKFSDKVGPACLPNKKNAFDLVEKYIKVLGWGRLWSEGDSPLTLHHVNLRVIPLQICRDAYGKTVDVTNPIQFCTYSKRKDSCQGDSGGPLVYLDPETNRYTLVGVVSYGMDCAGIKPGVNTDVAAHLDWIQKNIQRSNPNGLTCAKL